MDDYQLYFLNRQGERTSCFEFASANDERAQSAAEQFGCERGGELWCSSRRIRAWIVEPEPAMRPDERLQSSGARR